MERTHAVFLDKDGTLIVDVPYNADPAQIKLMPGAIAGLSRLAAAGFALVIVSNQSGVAHGYFAAAALAPVWQRIAELLSAEGIALAGCYYCPHHPDGRVARYTIDCTCRKPHPGLIQRAANELNLACEQSWMIGDTLDDVQAGKGALCRTILLDNGHETLWHWSAERVPDHVATDLDEAATLILRATAEQHTELARGQA